jgi:flagellar biosynthesis/type III secretory pathway ATPase
VREALAIWEESRDLIELGAYVSGTNPRLDAMMRIRSDITSFLRQDVAASSSRSDSLASLEKIAQLL